MVFAESIARTATVHDRPPLCHIAGFMQIVRMVLRSPAGVVSEQRPNDATIISHSSDVTTVRLEIPAHKRDEPATEVSSMARGDHLLNRGVSTGDIEGVHHSLNG